MPCVPGCPDIANWGPQQDTWELYYIDEDWSQAIDLAEEMPDKVSFMKALVRMPEFAAPKIGKFDNNVTMEVSVPEDANGVLYALGEFSGGLACYVNDGVLSYEYNLFEIDRTQIKAKEKLPTGEVTIEVETRLLAKSPGAPAQITLNVNGQEVASGQVPITAPLAFAANDCLDFGSDLGSPVSLDYFDQAPFKFNGTLGTSTIKFVK